ncbi:MarR family winged helix-turn-helix transcriptional regulator [Shewanella sp. A14]
MHDHRAMFGIRFSTLSRQWRRYLDQHLSRYGINDVTWVPLIHLDDLGDGVNQKQLAKSVGIEGPAQVRLLDTLEKRGHIVRKICDTDRRSKLVYLTAAGSEQVKEVRSHLIKIETDILSRISDDQLANFHQVLDILEANIAE